MSKSIISLAGEYFVAGEICRRNLYAQLTLGPRKRTDILIESETGFVRIQVKTKSGTTWPHCKGTYGDNILLVLVDLDKPQDEKPDYYILTVQDWCNLIKEKHKEEIANGFLVLDEKNTPVWPKNVGKSGQPYKGTNISLSDVSIHKEKWEKVTNIIS